LKDRISLTKYLKNDKIQRLIYFVILLLWMFVGVNFVKYKHDSNPFYFDIFYAIVFPTIILIAHIIINKKIFWLLAFVCALFHGVWTTCKTVLDYLVIFPRNYNQNLTWILKNGFISLSLIVVSFLVTWIIWKIKPLNKNTT